MIRVALFGFGTVGRGVVEQIDSNPNRFELVKIFDRPANKDKIGSRFEGEKEKILQDPSIDVVIEAMGGDTLAHEVITSALKAHKHVITSNKETVSHHLSEYLSLAKDNGVSFQCEASVGGGIPLLAPINQIATIDEITSLEGILNGTTNFILTRMEEGMKYEEALRIAQQKGFAEHDPTADVEGLDLVRKLSILASIATRRKVDVKKIPHYGLSHVTQGILHEIQKENRVLKYIAEFSLENGSLEMAVTPKALKKDNPLASLKEELNGVSLVAKNNGPLAFFGRGAGKEATAVAILQDLLRVEEGIALPPFLLKEEESVKAEKEKEYLLFKGNEKRRVKNPRREELDQADFVVEL